MPEGRHRSWAPRLGVVLATLALWVGLNPVISPCAQAAERLGLNDYVRLQRSLNLLTRSTASRRQTLRMAYYGHPFGDPVWWTNLVEQLRRDHPQTEILATNLALDVHTSDQLLRAAEVRLFREQPDLIVLATIGDPHAARTLVRQIRERMAADVLLVTDPLRTADRLDEPTDPKVIAPDPKKFRTTPETWLPWLNYVWMPGLAAEFEVGLADVRTGWKERLREKRLSPGALLPDNRNLTAEGHQWMVDLLRPWFDPPPGLPFIDPWDNPRISTYQIPRDARWQKGRLRLEFTGTRVEALLSAKVNQPVEIRIDGRPPSASGAGLVADGFSAVPGTRWPALLKVGSVETPVVEDWTAFIHGLETNPAGGFRFSFRLSGSQTGNDGEGSSDRPFVSTSRRVVIEPADWNVSHVIRHFLKTPPAEFEVRWKVRADGTDVLTSANSAAGDRRVVLAAALPPRAHVVELLSQGEAVPAIEAIRVYRGARPPETRPGR